MVLYDCALSGFGISSDGTFTASSILNLECSTIPTANSYFLCAALMCFIVTCYSAGRKKGDVHSLPPALNA